MKTTKIVIKNLFGIKETELDGRSVEISGPKGSGKTSVLDSIRYALTNRSDRDYIVHRGADEGEILIETDTGLSIDRKALPAKSAGTVKVRDGSLLQTRPAEFLSQIFTPLQLNPVEFTQLSRQEKNRVILNLIEFAWDTNWIREQFGEIPQGVDYSKHILEVLHDIQAENGVYFQSRQNINRDIRNKQAFVSDIAKDIPSGYDFDHWNTYPIGEKYVSEKAYRKICKLLKLMIHPDLHCSMYDGLEDYAWFLIAAVFCTRRREDDRRFYQTAILEIARKNFKTFNSAIIFILGMLTEPRFSRFFSVAPDFKLSSELRLAVRKIIKVSPALTKYFKINRDMITCLINEIEYTPLAYSNDGMDGRLANIFLADEAGALDSYPVEAMRSSQITLVNKLGIIISTQYPNDNNVMIDEVDIAKKVLDGVLEKENVFALLYEPDDALRKRWETDDLVIYQANPVAVNNKEVFDSIKDLRTMAILYENKRENFLCKHCNIMYKGLGVEGYIDVQKVRRCRVAENLDFWCGRRVWVGLDLSQSDDNTSVAMVTEADGVIHAKVWGILPKDRIEIKTKKENVDYRKLIAAGSCFAEGEEVIDYGFVERWILGLEEKYGVEVMQVGYDRYNAISTVQKLEANSMECVEVKQHSSVLHPPTKLLREAILKKEFAYDENRLLEINFQNARCTEDTNLNKYVNKKRSAGKVDMVVSTIIAVYLMQQAMLDNSELDWGIQVI